MKPLFKKEIGRNDPCHCGSGKKYKKCCMDQDEKNESRQVADEYYERIKKEEILTDSQIATRKALDWISEHFEDVIINSVAHFIGSPDIDEAKNSFPGEEGGQILSQLLNEYALIDYEDESLDSTLLKIYFQENKEMLSEKEMESLLIKMNTYKTLYEVQKIKKEKGLLLKDYFSDDTFWVEERKATATVKKWDIIFARVETHPDGIRKMTGSLVDFPREAEDMLHELKNQYEEDKEMFKGNDEMWLFHFRQWITPLIFQNIIEYYSSFSKNLMSRLVNKEGDKIVFCEKNADVSNYEKIDSYLCGHDLLTLTYEDEKEKVYGWLDDKKSIIASFYLKKRKITVETNSRERTERVEKKFMADIQGWTKNWKTEYKNSEKLLDEKYESDEKMTMETQFWEGNGRRMSKKEEEKMLARFTRKHYNDWIDMELPALDGMTPREASKDSGNKEKLIELLKTMENKSSHNKKIVGFDIERIKKKLGIKF